MHAAAVQLIVNPKKLLYDFGTSCNLGVKFVKMVHRC